MKVFTKDQISLHNSQNSCWIIIDNGVYDVTKFLDDHPGGKQVFVAYAGTDCTDEFKQVQHSSEAKLLLSKYQIGSLKK